MPGPETLPTHADSFIVFSEEDAETPDIQVLNWSDSWYTPVESDRHRKDASSRVCSIRGRLYRAVKTILGHY